MAWLQVRILSVAPNTGGIDMTLTEQQIKDIWVNTPPQGDPTGKKFAVVFGQALLDAAKQLEKEKEKV